MDKGLYIIIYKTWNRLQYSEQRIFHLQIAVGYLTAQLLLLALIVIRWFSHSMATDSNLTQNVTMQIKAAKAVNCRDGPCFKQWTGWRQAKVRKRSKRDIKIQYLKSFQSAVDFQLPGRTVRLFNGTVKTLHANFRIWRYKFTFLDNCLKSFV